MNCLRKYYTMPRCAVLGCRNDSRDVNHCNSGISYHRFPSDFVTKQKWIWASGRQYWRPSKSATICSMHFKSEDYNIYRTGQRYIRDGAVPSLRIFSYDNKEKRMISDSDGDQEPTTSTDCQTNTKDTNQGNYPDDDDDIICVDESPTKPPKAKDKTTAAGNNATRKRKIRLTQSNKVHKLDVPNDELQIFANNIAAQLRTLPLDVALNLQTEMYQLVAKERSERYRMSQVADGGVAVKVVSDE